MGDRRAEIGDGSIASDPGAVNVWFLEGTTYVGGASLFTVADANWHIEAVGDHNDDGKPI